MPTTPTSPDLPPKPEVLSGTSREVPLTPEKPVLTGVASLPPKPQVPFPSPSSFNTPARYFTHPSPGSSNASKGTIPAGSPTTAGTPTPFKSPTPSKQARRSTAGGRQNGRQDGGRKYGTVVSRKKTPLEKIIKKLNGGATSLDDEEQKLVMEHIDKGNRSQRSLIGHLKRVQNRCHGLTYKIAEWCAAQGNLTSVEGLLVQRLNDYDADGGADGEMMGLDEVDELMDCQIALDMTREELKKKDEKRREQQSEQPPKKAKPSDDDVFG